MPNTSIAAAAGRNQTLISQLRDSVHSVLCNFIVNSNIVVSFQHGIRARIRGCWAIAEEFLASFCGNTLKSDRYLHILLFLHYRDNNAETDRKADNCDRLREVRTIFDTLNGAYEHYCKPSEHFDADEIIIKFQFRVVRETEFSSASRSTVRRKDSVT
jgi:hypothetical protein